MRITKYEHACLVVSTADELLIVDPGSFLTPPSFAGAVGVVVTHQHADHWTPEHLRRILEQSADIPIFGPKGFADAASDFDVTVVAAGDKVEAGSFQLEFFGERHAIIHESIPVIDNVGVLINDELYYAGDSYTLPGVPVGTLAAPIGAPWLKIGEAMDYVLAVKPKRALFTHDMTLSVAGKTAAGDRLKWATQQGGGDYFPLEPGDTLDL